MAKLKKKKGPGAVSVPDLEDGKREGGELNGGGERGPDSAAMSASNAVSRRSSTSHCNAVLRCHGTDGLQVSFVFQSTPSPSADLLGMRSAAPMSAAPTSAGSLLVDVFSEAGPAAPSAAVNDDGFLR